MYVYSRVISKRCFTSIQSLFQFVWTVCKCTDTSTTSRCGLYLICEWFSMGEDNETLKDKSHLDHVVMK